MPLLQPEAEGCLDTREGDQWLLLVELKVGRQVQLKCTHALLHMGLQQLHCHQRVWFQGVELQGMVCHVVAVWKAEIRHWSEVEVEGKVLLVVEGTG